jgi:hypothetical protein
VAVDVVGSVSNPAEDLPSQPWKAMPLFGKVARVTVDCNSGRRTARILLAARALHPSPSTSCASLRKGFCSACCLMYSGFTRPKLPGTACE